MKKKFFGLAALALALGAGLMVMAASGRNLVGYQGRLAGPAGAVPADGDYNLVFSIYDGATASAPLWTEPQTLAVIGGLYHARLGAVVDLPDEVFSGGDRWLGVKVGADPEMTPRSLIHGAAYALDARRIGGNKILSGRATLSVSSAASGTVAVNFPSAFAAPPRVLAGALSSPIGAESFVLSGVSNLTATGCNFNFVSLHGVSSGGSAEFDWVAIGN